jgi:hypothetical protein
MDYRVAPWPQAHGAFTPFVSVLDLLAWLPAGDAADRLRPATLPWREMLERKESVP